MQIRQPSLWIATVAASLFVACRSADVSTSDTAHAAGPLGPSSTAMDSGNPGDNRAGQSYDAARIDVAGTTTAIRFAVTESWSDPIELEVQGALGDEVFTARDETGAALSAALRGERLVVDPGATRSGTWHAIAVTQPAGALLRILPENRNDRVHLTLAALGGARKERYVSVVPASLSIDGAPPRTSGEAEAALDAFTRFCEDTLLVRAPRGAATYPGGIAGAWFGGLVSPAEGTRGAAVTGLVSVLADWFADVDPASAAALEAAGHTPRGLDDSWVVPRYAALRRTIGEVPFAQALRELVERHRGAGPIDAAAVSSVFRDVAGDEAGAFVDAWFKGPARPTLRTNSRYDEARGRLLLRIDQTHEVSNGVPAAYPIDIPVRIVLADGDVIGHSVRMRNRRELLPIDCPSEPATVTIDPDGWFKGLLDIEAVPPSQ